MSKIEDYNAEFFVEPGVVYNLDEIPESLKEWILSEDEDLFGDFDD